MTNASDDAAVAEVLAAEEDRAKAIEENDWDAMDGILADEYEYTHSTGRTEDKATWLAGMKARARVVERGDLQVRVYGDTALVHGESQYRYAEPFKDDDHYGLRIDAFQVWARRGGSWKLVASHNVKTEATQKSM